MAKCAFGRSPSCVSCLKAAGCDTAWSSCTGWTPPSATLVSEACSDDDTGIFNGGRKDRMQSDLTACGEQCLGAKDCVTSCMVSKEKYSQSCATCFGTLTACTKDHCMLKCAFGRNPSCVSCLKAAGCDTAWSSCTGWTPPSATLSATLVSEACSDDDTGIFNGGGKDRMQSDLTACGEQCLGAKDCVPSCMVSKEKYSQSCATCF